MEQVKIDKYYTALMNQLYEEVEAAEVNKNYEVGILACERALKNLQDLETENLTDLQRIDIQYGVNSALEKLKHLTAKTKLLANESTHLATISSREFTKIRKLVLNSVVIEIPDIHYDDVIGASVAKQAIAEAIAVPTQFPNTAQASNVWKGILLYGPTGTGKTLLARALAAEAGMTFINANISTLISKWQGESSKSIQVLFEIARERSPSILLLDECDQLCRQRKEDESNSEIQITSKLLTEMDGFQSGSEKVLVIGCTNLPQTIDSGFRRRFEKLVYVPLPTTEEKYNMLEHFLKEYNHFISKAQMRTIARKHTDKFSGYDIYKLVREAGLVCCRERMETRGFGVKVGPVKEKLRKTTFEDILTALKNVVPTNDDALLDSIEKFHAKFGENNGYPDKDIPWPTESLAKQLFNAFLDFF